MKTNKHQTLAFVKQKGAVVARDIVDQFQYSPATARSYLAYLNRQSLLQRISVGHVLTGKGETRLHFFEVMGCSHPECIRCERNAGYYTCPTCRHQLLLNKAHLQPVWDTPFFKRAAGVYCSVCQGQIVSEAQASIISQTKEKL